MAIDKIFPRKLSKSKDVRLRKKDEMTDALNLRVTEDNKDFPFSTGDVSVAGSDDSTASLGNSVSETNDRSVSGASGNSGVLKPVQGNTMISFSDDTDINPVDDLLARSNSRYKIVGKVEDKANNHVYLFMWHDLPDKHSVLRYSDAVEQPDGGPGVESMETIFTSKFLNFQVNSVVQGVVTHVSDVGVNEGSGQKTLLYFTDNYNEPRCLDIKRCLDGDIPSADLDVVEFISLCPVTPLEPIVTEWDYDSTRTISNFKNVRGFQFAYQNVYKDDVVSAFSIYSRLSINPAYLSQGADPTPEIDAYNKLLIRVPVQSPNVSFMKLYGREGNNGPWFFIGDIDNGSGDITTSISSDPNTPVNRNFITYEFYNDQIVSFVPEEESFKQFDNVPQLADAIALSNDRLFLGNYVEGYDPVDVSGNLIPLYNSRPQDFTEMDILAIPEVRVISSQTGCPNRVAGYRIDLSGLGDVAAGTTINLNIVVAADNDFHIYNSQGSHHASVFAIHPDGSSDYKDKIEDNTDQLLFDDQGAESYDPTKQYFGKVVPRSTSFGGMSTQVKDIGWDPVAAAANTPQSNPSAAWGNPNEGMIDVAYGTGASNPLILQSKTMSFGCRIFFEQDFTAENARALISQVFSGTELISGAAGQDASDFTPTINNNYAAVSGAVVLDQNTRDSYSINCGLQNLSIIDGVNPDPNRARVCAVGDRSLIEGANPTGLPPCGYFIVNRGTATFRMTAIDDAAIFDDTRTFVDGTEVDVLGVEADMSAQDYTQDIFVALDLENLTGVQVLTCLPDIAGGLSPTSFSHVCSLLDSVHDTNIGAGSLFTTINYSDGIERRYLPGTNTLTSESNRQPFRLGHTVSKWVCVSPTYMTSQLLGGTSSQSSSFFDLFDPYMAEDYRKIVDGNFIGGYSMDYSQGNASRTYWNGQQSDPEFPEPVEQSYEYDYSTSDLVLSQLQKLFGVLRLPGQSNAPVGPTPSPNDIFTAALEGVGGSTPQGTFGASGLDYSGALVCTPRRMVLAAREIGTTLPEANLSEHAALIRSSVLAYTMVDGESGPGSNREVSSINSTTIRDGILYYLLGAGTNGYNPSQYQSNFTIEGYPDIISALAWHVSMGGYGSIASLGAFRGIGYQANPFQFYLAQPDYSIYWTDGINTNYDFPTPVGSVAAHYDGQLFGDGDESILASSGTPVSYTGDIGPEWNGSNRLIRSGVYRHAVVNIVGNEVPTDEEAEFDGGYGVRENLGWYRLRLPQVETVQQISFIQTSGDGFDTRTFKTNATHNFGIVYSDFYGRQSSVFPIGSVFVPPYEQHAISEKGGSVNMGVVLQSDPPSWAYSYQIVYGGNTSIEDFIQYSAGGAYLVPVESSTIGADDLGVVSTANIYVSLNYLQGNSDVSYTDAFGARNDEGLNRMWDFQPGDKVKVISYYEGGNRKFANNVVFDVVNQVQLGVEDNPLVSNLDGLEVPNTVQGEFLVLKNNPYASGFDVASIKDGIDLWNNRCIIEIYRPASSSNVEDRPFYEIGESYKIIRTTSTIIDATTQEETTVTLLSHEAPLMVLTQGDTYFRRLPVNLPRTSGGSFSSIINEEGASQPSFMSYFLESPRFNDLIAGARQTNFGRPKVVQPLASKVRRASSVVFSDQNDYSTKPLKLNSFNATTSNFKDIPNSYGEIACLIDYNEGLFVLQKNKASFLPVNRTILSDVVGNDTVVATQRVVGTQKYYAGDYGCDTNPESVVMVGNTIYWCNKRMREVYRFNPSSGIEVISDNGMRSYFDGMFASAQNVARLSGGPVRCVGGYDPRNQEYILSVFNQITFSWNPNPDIVQPTGEVIEADIQDEEAVGNLDLEQEAALIAAYADAFNQVSLLTDQNASLEAQLADLYAQLNEETTADPSPNNPNISDLFEEIFDLEQQLETNVPVLQENIDNQVAFHEQIRQEALAVAELAGSQLVTLQDEGFAATAGEYTLASTGNLEYDLDDLITNFEERTTAMFNTLVIGFELGTTTALLRNGNEYSFTIGYGAGPEPTPGSFIAENGQQALVDELNSLRVFRNDLITFGTQPAQDLISKVVEQEEEITELQAQKQAALNQIGAFASAIRALRVADPDKGNLDDVPANYGEAYAADSKSLFTTAAFNANPDATVNTFRNLINSIADAHEAGEDELILDQIYDAEEGVITGLGSNILQQYFNTGFGYNFYAPNRLRRLEQDAVTTTVIATRDALAGALNNTVSALATGFENAGAESDETFNTLVQYQVDPTIAALLIDPGTDTTAIIQALDADGDGDVTVADIDTVLPSAGLAAAFTEFASEETITVDLEGVVQPQEVLRVWDQLANPIGELFDEIIDVTVEAGVRDSGSTYSSGYTAGDIGIVNELRDFFNSTTFTDADDPAVVTQKIEQLKNRVSGGGGNVSLIDSLTVLKNTLADAVQPVVNKRFHTDITVGQAGFVPSGVNANPQDELRYHIGAGAYSFNPNSGPFKGGFNGKVLQAVNDIDFAIDVAKEFQDLFTFEQRPSNVTAVLSSTERNPNIDPATSGQTVSIGNVEYELLFTGREGVTAGDVLRGASIVGRSPAGQNFLGQSTLYAFANAMTTVNQRIKDLAGYAAAQLDDGNVDGLGTSPITIDQVSYRTPLNKSGETILQPQVEGSLITNITGAVYPEAQRNLRLNLQPAVNNDLANAYELTSSGGLGRAGVEDFIDGLLTPGSGSFSGELMNFIVDNYVQYGFSQYPTQIAADLNGDGAVATADLLEFLSVFGQDVSTVATPGSINNVANASTFNDVIDAFSEYGSFSDFSFSPVLSQLGDISQALTNIFESIGTGDGIVITGIGGDDTTTVTFDDDNSFEDDGDDNFDPNDFIRD